MGICLPSLWSRMRTQGVYDTSQTCSGSVEGDGFKVSNLFERLSDNVSNALSVLEGRGGGGAGGTTATPDGINRCPSRKFRITSYVL